MSVPPALPLPPGAGDRQTEGKAVVALVLAVAAWLPVVPFFGAVAALVLARTARHDILASGGRLTGLGLVMAARVVAWLHLLFVLLLVLLVVAALLGVVAFSVFGVHVGG